VSGIGWTRRGVGAMIMIFITLFIYVHICVRRFHSPATVETDAVSCGENYCFVRYSEETIIIMWDRKNENVWDVIKDNGSISYKVSRHRPSVIKFVFSRHSNSKIIVALSIYTTDHIYYTIIIHTCARHSILHKRKCYNYYYYR